MNLKEEFVDFVGRNTTDEESIADVMDRLAYYHETKVKEAYEQGFEHGLGEDNLKMYLAQARQSTIVEIKGVVEEWKNGNCKDCTLPSGKTVPNWNCKGHAHSDLLTKLNDLNK